MPLHSLFLSSSSSNKRPTPLRFSAGRLVVVATSMLGCWCQRTTTTVHAFGLTTTTTSHLSRRTRVLGVSRRSITRLFSAQQQPVKQQNRQNDVVLSSLPCVILKRNQQSKSFRNGNQLVFSRAIQRIENLKSPDGEDEPAVGQLVQVEVVAENRQNNGDTPQKQQRSSTVVLGWGVYNPNSLYKVRILCHRFLLSPTQHQALQAILGARGATAAEQLDQSNAAVLAFILQHQMRQALHTRRALHLWPPGESRSSEARTDTFRLLNGEGDSLSGLAVDVIGGRIGVVMSSAAWCQVHKATILDCLQQVFVLPQADDNDDNPQQQQPKMEWVWKTTPARLQQDGYENGNENEDLEDDKGDHSAQKEVLAWENGIGYATWPYETGQKTGVYCDQRENRLAVARYCRHQRVLDLCCYHGGFALNAVRHGGARHATGVDSSQDAIDACWQNAKLLLNEHDDDSCSERLHFVRSDVTTFLQQAVQEQSYYDVVILDPPKLAPSVKALDKARRKYQALNRDALKVINPDDGGLLLTCTCSAAMTQRDGGQYFLQMVQSAALAAGRQVALLQVSGAAPCHTQSPVASPAGAYLTAALFRVHPI